MMSATGQVTSPELTVPPDQAFRKSIQRLRWFRSTFEEQVEAIGTKTAIEFKLDPEVLTECFVNWIRSFEAGKPAQANFRLAYVGFAAGQMLKELIVKKPLSVVSMPKATDETLPEYFWPEGFVYVAYCLNVRRAVMQQDFGINIEESPRLEELRTWWSFKENVRENPSYALSFLDMFAGETPSWTGSGLFNGSERTAQLEQLIAGQLPAS